MMTWNSLLQENSLHILNMGVNFVNEQSARNVSNIDNTTKNLLQGAAVILSSASKDNNEKVNTDFLPLNMFNKRRSEVIGHFRYINILTSLRGFQDKTSTLGVIF